MPTPKAPSLQKLINTKDYLENEINSYTEAINKPHNSNTMKELYKNEIHNLTIKLNEINLKIATFNEKKEKLLSEAKEQKLTDPLRYDSASDVSMRLEDTVVRYKGEPVYCSHYDELYVNLFPIDKPFHQAHCYKMIHSSNVDLDVSSPPLGYMNTEKYTFYLQRAPVRKQKQGLVIKAMEVWFESTFEPFDQHVDPYAAFKSISGKNTILGIYPSGLECISKIMNESVKSIAFSRKFAFAKDELGLIKLKHMTRTIGWTKGDNNKIVIPPTFADELIVEFLAKEKFEVI